MRIVVDPADLPPPKGRRGFVPSLGNLHRGHLSLVEKAKELCDEVVVSIFVNPTQFRDGEDFERYPRTPEHDLEMCKSAGVDYVFMPTREVMYPAGESAVSIHVDNVGDDWEGAIRPGHFDGVATVVANLFLSVKPNIAVFGQKDLQQNAVIRRLLSGMRLGVSLHIAPTIREADGLALSSRNAYLSQQDRQIAPQLYRALCTVREQLRARAEPNSEDIIRSTVATMDPKLKIQYFSMVNSETMEKESYVSDRSSLIAAAHISATRLIDNISVCE